MSAAQRCSTCGSSACPTAPGSYSGLEKRRAFPRSPSTRAIFPRVCPRSSISTSSTLAAPTAIRTRATRSRTTSYASSTTRVTWRSSSTTAPSCCSMFGTDSEAVRRVHQVCCPLDDIAGRHRRAWLRAVQPPVARSGLVQWKGGSPCPTSVSDVGGIWPFGGDRRQRAKAATAAREDGARWLRCPTSAAGCSRCLRPTSPSAPSSRGAPPIARREAETGRRSVAADAERRSATPAGRAPSRFP